MIAVLCDPLTKAIADLPHDDRVWLMAATARVTDASSRIVRDVVLMGRYIVAVRQKLSGSAFREWCETYLPCGMTTARKAVQLTRLFPAESLFEESSFGEMPEWAEKAELSALYVVARPSCPPSVRDEVLKLAERGERVTRERAVKLVRAASKAAPRAAAAPPGLELALDRLDELGQSGEMRFTGDANEPAAKSISLTFGEYKLLLNRLAPELYRDSAPPPKPSGPTPPPGSPAKVLLMAARAAAGLSTDSPDDTRADDDHAPVFTARPGGAGRVCPSCGQRQKPAPVVADEWSELHRA